jgi:hypothetical protein
MKHKTFPFYIEDKYDFPSLIDNVTVLYQICFVDKITDKFFKKIPLENKCNSVSTIYHEFLKAIESRLKAEYFSNFIYLCNQLIESLDKDLIMDEIDLELVFCSIKNSLVNNVPIDDRLIDTLHHNLLGEGDIYLARSCFLMRSFGFDIDATKAYFDKIRLLKNQKVKEIFSTIAIKGMKILSASLIDEGLDIYDNKAVKFIRQCSESYCIYIELLRDIKDVDDCFCDGLNILTLMRAAHHDGKIVQEFQFYEDKSFAVMASLGTSFRMKNESKPKTDLYAQAEEEIKQRYGNGSKILHNEMVDEILKEQKFKRLKRYRLLPIASRIASPRGFVRGKKDGGKSD